MYENTKTIRGFTLIELMIVVAIIGLLAGLAIPNFIKFQARSKQSEVKANLRALFTAEKSYFAEKDTYSALVHTIGFSPERGNRYTYYLGDAMFSFGSENRSGIVTGNAPPSVAIEADTFKYDASTGTSYLMPAAFTAVVVTGNTGWFTCTAAGNIDRDTTTDQWSISSLTRVSGVSSNASTSCAAGNNPAGEPCVDNDDTVR